MTTQNLYDYVRVQIELDITATRTADEVIDARIETLNKLIERLNTLR